MGTPQDWAPYCGSEDAAKVYLRDPVVALDQLRGVVDFPSIQSFFMSRRLTEESWRWHKRRWRPTAAGSSCGAQTICPRVKSTSGRCSTQTILLSTITDHILTTEFEVLNDGTRRLSEVRLRMYTQLVTRSHEKSATGTDYFCESFRYDKSVDNGGLAQMERLLQFGRVLSRSM